MAKPTILTKQDLRAFDDQSQEYIFKLQSYGWRGYVSNRGHAIMHAPDGETTTSVTKNHSASSRNRANAEAEFNRWLEQQTLPTPTPAAPKSERWPCPRCNKVFNSEDNLSTHNNADHENLLACPDCSTWHRDLRNLNRHRAAKHGYRSPHYEKRKQQEAARNAGPIIQQAAEQHEERVQLVDDLAAEHVTETKSQWRDLDIEQLGDQSLAQLTGTLKAAGLQLRIQVR